MPEKESVSICRPNVRRIRRIIGVNEVFRKAKNLATELATLAENQEGLADYLSDPTPELRLDYVGVFRDQKHQMVEVILPKGFISQPEPFYLGERCLEEPAVGIEKPEPNSQLNIYADKANLEELLVVLSVIWTQGRIEGTDWWTQLEELRELPFREQYAKSGLSLNSAQAPRVNIIREEAFTEPEEQLLSVFAHRNGVRLVRNQMDGLRTAGDYSIGEKVDGALTTEVEAVGSNSFSIKGEIDGLFALKNGGQDSEAEKGFMSCFSTDSAHKRLRWRYTGVDFVEGLDIHTLRMAAFIKLLEEKFPSFVRSLLLGIEFVGENSDQIYEKRLLMALIASREHDKPEEQHIGDIPRGALNRDLLRDLSESAERLKIAALVASGQIPFWDVGLILGYKAEDHVHDGMTTLLSLADAMVGGIVSATFEWPEQGRTFYDLVHLFKYLVLEGRHPFNQRPDQVAKFAFQEEGQSMMQLRLGALFNEWKRLDLDQHGIEDLLIDLAVDWPLMNSNNIEVEILGNQAYDALEQARWLYEMWDLVPKGSGYIKRGRALGITSEVAKELEIKAKKLVKPFFWLMRAYYSTQFSKLAKSQIDAISRRDDIVKFVFNKLIDPSNLTQFDAFPFFFLIYLGLRRAEAEAWITAGGKAVIKG